MSEPKQAVELSDYELTRLLAEKVMGWECKDALGNIGFWAYPTERTRVLVWRDGRPDPYDAWLPLSRIQDAFMLVDAILSRGELWFRLTSPWLPPEDNVWRAGFTPCGVTGWNGRMDMRAMHTDRCRAIVLACLEAVRGELTVDEDSKPILPERFRGRKS